MTRVLTQEELEALRVMSDEVAAAGRARAAAPAMAYNFRRQDHFSKEQMRSLQVLHERFVKQLSTRFSAYLRAQTDFTVVSIDQCSYAEYLTTVADPTAFYSLSLAPFEAPGALEINPLVAFALIDRVMGGGGTSAAPNRGLTDIELTVVDSMVRLLLEGLTETWKPVSGATFAVQARETRSRMLPVAQPDDAMVVIALDAQIGAVKGLVSVCLPAAVVEHSHKDSAHARKRLPPAVTPLEREWMLEHLGRVAVAVTPIIETRLSGRDVLALEAGDIVSLGLPVHEPVTVQIGGIRKLRGRLVASDAHAMIQVVGSPAAGLAATGER
jgi:flagellar motor switch protein FliM